MAPFLEYLYRDKKFIKALESKLNIVEGALTPDDLFLIYDSYKDNIWDNFICVCHDYINTANENSRVLQRFWIFVGKFNKYNRQLSYWVHLGIHVHRCILMDFQAYFKLDFKKE